MTTKTAGRILAVLLLAQSTASYLANFALLSAATAPPGFLENAASHSLQVTFAMLLMLTGGALWVGIAITAVPVFRRHNQTLALWLLALATVCFSTLVLEGVAVRVMLALSQDYLQNGAANAALYHTAAVLIRAVRAWAHYANILVSGFALLVFYGTLFWFGLVPRALASLGLLAALPMIAGALIPIFGQPVIMLMFAPMGLSHLALVIWLSVYGLEDRTPARPKSAALLGTPA
jgi:hypothetical protein